MKKRIVLCADDYGQALPISLGILDLVKNGRLTAVSCMVNMSGWAEHAQWLLPFRSQLDLGLHFNLTEGEALSTQYKQQWGRQCLTLSQMLWRAQTRRLLQTVVEAECHAQLDAFEQAMGCLPDYVDGHQHVHQFPVIRSALVAVYEKRLRSRQVYIRLVNEMPNPPFFLKKLIIHATGTRAFHRLLNKQVIPHNASFAGIYAFNQAHEYRRFFNVFLQRISDKGLIMCHPGRAHSTSNDVISNARSKEHAYLTSEDLLADCHRHGVILSRLFL